MGLLNIFLHSDGTTAWDNLLILALAFVAGWLLHPFIAKRSVDKKHREAIAEWESKYKRLEGEYKNHKANISGMERHNEKAVVELTSRAKALEGDIRALAEEKNRVLHQLTEKDQEIRRCLQQISERDDTILGLQESGARTEEDWAEKLKAAAHSLTKALAWEEKAKNAEAEARRLRELMGHAERKKLEAELRLKTVAEYAGKIGPLENELALKDGIIAGLREQLELAGAQPKM
jgi:chromosome segregation ATPase